jgi:hypothetical protein
MFKRCSLASLFAAICLLATSAVHATPYRIDFNANNFEGILPGYAAAPQSSVSGYFEFTSHDQFTTVDAMTAVGLTIDGHSYTFDQVGHENWGLGHIFGGKLEGPLMAASGTNDFYIYVSPLWDEIESMVYTSNSANGGWVSYDIDYTLTSPVPEPSSAALLLIAMGALALASRRRKQK